MGVLGAGLVAVSGPLTWLTGTQTAHQNGYDTPARFLIDSHASAGGVSLGVVLLVVGAIGAISAVLAGGRIPAIVVGVIAVLIAGMYVYQLRLAVHDLNRANQLRLHVRDVIGIGPFAAAAGGVVAVIGALLPGRRAEVTGVSAESAEPPRR